MFLFGMDIMGKALERQAGGKLQTILAKMSSNVFRGFLLGLGVTAVIQSSSATTVMVVGFVNFGIMILKQAVGVIMGSNISTTVTAWILSLSGMNLAVNDNRILNTLLYTVSDIERTADHCSNVAVEMLQVAEGKLEAHEYLNALKSGELHKSAAFNQRFAQYKAQYAFPEDLA